MGMGKAEAQEHTDRRCQLLSMFGLEIGARQFRNVDFVSEFYVDRLENTRTFNSIRFDWLNLSHELCQPLTFHAAGFSFSCCSSEKRACKIDWNRHNSQQRAIPLEKSPKITEIKEEKTSNKKVYLVEISFFSNIFFCYFDINVFFCTLRT